MTRIIVHTVYEFIDEQAVAAYLDMLVEDFNWPVERMSKLLRDKQVELGPERRLGLGMAHTVYTLEIKGESG